MGVFPSEAVFPFLGTTRFTVIAKRAGSVVGRLSDRTALAGGMSLGEVAIPCAGAADSGDVEIEVQAQVAGLGEAASAGLVARATVAVVCPVTKEPNPDADACSGGPAGPDADCSSGGGDPGPDGGVSEDVAAPAPPMVVPPRPDTDAAAADAAPTSSSSGCTMAPAGGLPWWSALAALGALVRLRRARRH